MTACDALDGSHHQHRGAKVRCHSMGSECLLSATNGSQDHAAATSAYPPTGDIRWPMSVIVLFTSASPPTPDVAGVGHESS